jgi:hydrogen peroxide-dependent heme synthase
LGASLDAEVMDATSDEYKTRVNGYADRLEGMNRQRLTPDFPPYRAMCFYPMNKRRGERNNWFTLSPRERAELMESHGTTGRKYAGRIVQMITGAMGLDDWEWGVTLFAHDPLQFKKLVYEMRFDRVSALYADFGPFYTGIRTAPDDLADILRR